MTKEADQPSDSDRKGARHSELTMALYGLGYLAAHLQSNKQPLVPSSVFIALKSTPEGAEGVVVDFASGELYTAIHLEDGDLTVIAKDGGIRAKVLGVKGDFGQTRDGQATIIADLQIALRRRLLEMR